MARASKTPAPKQPETFFSRAGQAALDNPVAAGGAVVMGLTACLIIANAVGLQPGRHPAPIFSTRERSEAVQVPEPDGRRGGGLKVQEISTLVLDVQISLRRLGLYEGPLDGLNGPATERAIRSFERKAGQAETGEASEALLALIMMHGESPMEASTPLPKAKPGYAGTVADYQTNRPVSSVDADPALKKLQQALSDYGYGPLTADGVMGSNTSDAIKRFELDNALPLTGEPGPRVIQRLEMLSGRSLSG
ncbi:peptidoglycan-binding protein [Rhodobacterales bacterium]|nr:peptidoglycan-binding protein [Rhodobacterales bacterium]